MKQKLNYLKYIFQGHPGLWVGLILCSAITGLDGIISPAVIGMLTNTLNAKDYHQVPQIIILFLLGLLLLNFGFWAWQYFNLKLIQVANTKLRGDAYKSFMQHPSEKQQSKTITYINVDVKQIENQFINAIVMIIYCFEQALITLIYILCINSWVALVYLVCGLLPTIVPKFTQKWIQKSTKEWSQKYKQYDLQVTEGVKGYHLINNYGVYGKMQQLINQALHKEEKSYFKMNLRQETSRLLSNITYTISTVLALTVGVIFIMNGQITVGAFISLYLAADRVTSPIISMVQFINQINASSPLLEAQFKQEDENDKVENLDFNPGQDHLLEIKNAAFGYDHPLLNEINLNVAAKAKVLIEGPSGVGKSTIFKTLLNEIPLLAGQISVNQKNQPAFSAQLGVISQDTFIFSDTLFFNLTLGENYTQDEVLNVLKKVGLEKYATPEGLAIDLGEKGAQLSGGEKRKIELARALLRKRSILLLDEAMSGLDPASQESVFKLIMNFEGTVIDIEHDLKQERKAKYSQILKLG